MVGDFVYRRLVKTRQNAIEVDQMVYDQGPASPEQLLWLAVIERAMIDYLDPPGSLRPKYKRGLEPFFFDVEPKPNNLAYICETLFESNHVADIIRKRVIALKQDRTGFDFRRARKLF